MAKNNVLTELEEDYNRERLSQFFKTYGKIIYTLAILVVVGVAGYEAWKYQDQKARTEAGDKLYNVISDFQNIKDTKDLEEVQKNRAYKEVGALVEANYQELKNNPEGMEKAYNKVANDASANTALKEIAKLNIISLKLNKNPADNSVEAELKNLAGDNAVFRYTAMEMLGSYYKKNGKNDEAKATYKKLSEDEKAPASISGRARSMLSSF